MMSTACLGAGHTAGSAIDGPAVRSAAREGHDAWVCACGARGGAAAAAHRRDHGAERRPAMVEGVRPACVRGLSPSVGRRARTPRAQAGWRPPRRLNGRHCRRATPPWPTRHGRRARPGALHDACPARALALQVRTAARCDDEPQQWRQHARRPPAPGARRWATRTRRGLQERVARRCEGGRGSGRSLAEHDEPQRIEITPACASHCSRNSLQPRTGAAAADTGQRRGAADGTAGSMAGSTVNATFRHAGRVAARIPRLAAALAAAKPLSCVAAAPRGRVCVRARTRPSAGTRARARARADRAGDSDRRGRKAEGECRLEEEGRGASHRDAATATATAIAIAAASATAAAGGDGSCRGAARGGASGGGARGDRGGSSRSSGARLCGADGQADAARARPTASARTQMEAAVPEDRERAAQLATSLQELVASVRPMWPRRRSRGVPRRRRRRRAAGGGAARRGREGGARGRGETP